MLNNKKFSKWYYDSEEEDFYPEEVNDRRSRLAEKKLKNAIKQRNVDLILQLEEDE